MISNESINLDESYLVDSSLDNHTTSKETTNLNNSINHYKTTESINSEINDKRNDSNLKFKNNIGLNSTPILYRNWVPQFQVNSDDFNKFYDMCTTIFLKQNFVSIKKYQKAL